MEQYLKVVDQLNRLLEIDNGLVESIVNTKYPVSEQYKDSEFVHSGEGAGLIGILSGLILNTEYFRFAAYYDDDDILIRFGLLELKDGKFVEVGNDNE